MDPATAHEAIEAAQMAASHASWMLGLQALTTGAFGTMLLALGRGWGKISTELRANNQDHVELKATTLAIQADVKTINGRVGKTQGEVLAIKARCKALHNLRGDETL